ncbi:hypothetical protein [Methanothrix sp.]|uniref:hypothetical protein n=1 Tax=Methanothrix sp. TaxID=90426 RepID=UPI0025E4F7E0|nr:hypothetical protein [Methanothrix sp.]
MLPNSRTRALFRLCSVAEAIDERAIAVDTPEVFSSNEILNSEGIDSSNLWNHVLSKGSLNQSS